MIESSLAKTSPFTRDVRVAGKPASFCDGMFHENYAFFSSTSAGMAAHFKQLADHLMRDHLQSPDPFVVEIGSNDGIMLQHFAKAGFAQRKVVKRKTIIS